MVVEIKGLGRIEADGDVLFEIAMSFCDSVMWNNSKGRTSLAIEKMEFFKTIHQALVDSGFYKTSSHNVK